MKIHYQDERAEVWHGDARSLPCADESVDLVVTSPPYYGLRSYQDGGEAYDGQIGAEDTPEQYLDQLVEATREMMRVLRPAGSIWVNLGDSYSAGRKTLLGIPWRYANRCVDELGLILRAEVVWMKPNAMPESVTDRVRRTHETWFHFTKQQTYFSNVDEIRQPYTGDRAWSRRLKKPGNGKRDQRVAQLVENPLGALPGSVWEVPTEPLTVPAHLGVDHCAAFPIALPARIIRGFTNEDGECRHCYGAEADNETCGDCMRHVTPAVVLDPFGGTGTTATAAKALGRRGITVDASLDYCRIAEWRVTDPVQLAKARGGKPQAVRHTRDQLEMTF